MVISLGIEEVMFLHTLIDRFFNTKDRDELLTNNRASRQSRTISDHFPLLLEAGFYGDHLLSVFVIDGCYKRSALLGLKLQLLVLNYKIGQVLLYVLSSE